MVKAATDMANCLAGVIRAQKLFTNIQGKEHVKVEGWATLGSMMGILPREVYVKRLEDGSYEAKVELYSLGSGQIVGGASALCGIDEKRWGGAEDYARRSMAITRATGKAYRLGFAWIMALAGYEACPAEEMPEAIQVNAAPRHQEEIKPKPKKEGYDPKVLKHRMAFEAALQKAGVEKLYWNEANDLMKGRESLEMEMVIEEVKRLATIPM